MPAIMLTDGPHGVRKQADDRDHARPRRQRAGHLLPAGGRRSAPRWDPDLLERVGAALGDEARARASRVLLGPGINIKRSPLCGRNFEYFSEDPLLGRRARRGAGCDGLQCQGVGASLKHFAANNQETDRHAGQRRRRRAHAARDLPAAPSSASSPQAQPWTVMCSYNRINGVYAIAEPLAAHRGAARRVGLRRARGLRLGRGRTTGSPRSPPGSTSRCRPDRGVGDAALVAAVARRRARRGRARRGASAGCCALVDRARRRRTPRPSFDVDAHHALAREVAGAQCDRAAEERAAACCRSPRTRPGHRRDRRVRPHPALPGRRQLAGQPDPARRRARRDPRRCAGDGRLRPRLSRVGERRDGPTEPTCARARRSRSPRRRRRRWSSSACPTATSPRASTATHIDLPAGAARADRARSRAVNPRTVVVLVQRRRSSRSAGWHDAVPRDPRGLAARPGRRRRDRRRAVRRGRTRPGGSPRRIPLRLEDTPSYLNFPGEHGHVRYGEGLFVGYRRYDARGQRGELPVRARAVVHDVRLRRPAGRRSPAPTPATTCASPSPTPASGTAGRSSRSTSPPAGSVRRPARELRRSPRSSWRRASRRTSRSTSTAAPSPTGTSGAPLGGPPGDYTVQVVRERCTRSCSSSRSRSTATAGAGAHPVVVGGGVVRPPTRGPGAAAAPRRACPADLPPEEAASMLQHGRLDADAPLRRRHRPRPARRRARPDRRRGRARPSHQPLTRDLGPPGRAPSALPRGPGGGECRGQPARRGAGRAEEVPWTCPPPAPQARPAPRPQPGRSSSSASTARTAPARRCGTPWRRRPAARPSSRSSPRARRGAGRGSRRTIRPG